MLYQLKFYAASENSDIFGVLGIDWKLLILQSIAFLIMLMILKKFVYPYLNRALDSRLATVEAGVKAAKEAEAKAAESHVEIEKLLSQARKEANDILTTAKNEATASIEAAEKKAKAKSDRITEQAREQIEQDVIEARATLRRDSLSLVAQATEKIIRTKLDSKLDSKLIESVLEEVK